MGLRRSVPRGLKKLLLVVRGTALAIIIARESVRYKMWPAVMALVLAMLVVAVVVLSAVGLSRVWKCKTKSRCCPQTPRPTPTQYALLSNQAGVTTGSSTLLWAATPEGNLSDDVFLDSTTGV